MFFARGKRHRRRGASQRIDLTGDEAIERQPRQWQAWRLSTQQVTRTWNEWLAADARQCAARYRKYISALTEEEHAACELELTVRLGTEAKRASACTHSSAHADDARRSHA
jgi:hypothetical protein